MGMLGNQLAAGQALTVANDSFNGNGSTVAFTLSQTVGANTDIEVLVDNVQQSPYDSSYSVSGTTLTFSGAPSAGTNNVYVIYNASRHIATSQVIPDDGSVHSSKIASNAVTDAKIAAVATSKLTGDIPYANMPVGSVIQVQETSNNTTQSTSSTNPIVILSISITPKLTSSKMILMGSTPVSVSVGTSNAYASTYIYDPGGNQLARSITGQAGYNSDQHALFAVHSPGSTSSQTYTFSLGSSSGGTGSVSTDGQTYNFIIMEIAQ